MKKQLISLISFIFLVAGISGDYSIQAQTRPNRGYDRQVTNLLTSIESKTTAYKTIVTRGNGRGGYNNNRNNDIASYIADFEAATGQLRQNLNSRQQINSSDVENVLTRANFIDNYMKNSRASTSAQSQWDSIKTDLSSLAKYYNVSWDWNNSYGSPNRSPNENGSYGPAPAPNERDRGNMRLSGTYRLNPAKSDDVQAAVDKVINNSINANQRDNNSNANQRDNNNPNQHDRFRQNLERRLSSPDTLVIDKANRQITMGSSVSPQMTINADGVARTEQNARGKTVSTKAESNGESLTISYEGDRTNDFYVTFTPIYNGQLKVTKRLYLENQNDTITVSSVYDKIGQTADWSSVNNGNNNGGYNQNNNGNNRNNSDYNQNNGGYSQNNNGDFLIPDGTKINAVLTSQLLSTKVSVDGDKFRMEVRAPAQYQGAIIEGHVIKPQSSGRVSGRAELSLDFDRITLRNGQTYRFEALIDDVRLTNGDKVSINNEGTVRDSNQTTKTVTRTGIGAGIGAIIGAIAGGGQGAAIGAAIGAGAGAGSVFIQGRDNLELTSGTEFNLTSTAPSNPR